MVTTVGTPQPVVVGTPHRSGARRIQIDIVTMRTHGRLLEAQSCLDMELCHVDVFITVAG